MITVMHRDTDQSFKGFRCKRSYLIIIIIWLKVTIISVYNTCVLNQARQKLYNDYGHVSIVTQFLVAAQMLH